MEYFIEVWDNFVQRKKLLTSILLTNETADLTAKEGAFLFSITNTPIPLKDEK